MDRYAIALLIFWPLLPMGLGAFFHAKQNSTDAWTGGPISWPKSLWLAYTVTTWFFCPLIFVTAPELSQTMILFFTFHLLSWWIRGPLELIMIYRWLNWSPRYGISHDLFHLVVTTFLLLKSLTQKLGASEGGLGFFASSGHISTPVAVENIALVFAMIIVFTTVAEICFAVLFLKIRTAQEQSENVYFASDDPKWRLVNRATLFAVIVAYGHLLAQSAWLLYWQLI